MADNSPEPRRRLPSKVEVALVNALLRVQDALGKVPTDLAEKIASVYFPRVSGAKTLRNFRGPPFFFLSKDAGGDVLVNRENLEKSLPKNGMELPGMDPDELRMLTPPQIDRLIAAVNGGRSAFLNALSVPSAPKPPRKEPTARQRMAQRAWTKRTPMVLATHLAMEKRFGGPLPSELSTAVLTTLFGKSGESLRSNLKERHQMASARAKPRPDKRYALLWWVTRKGEDVLAVTPTDSVLTEKEIESLFQEWKASVPLEVAEPVTPEELEELLAAWEHNLLQSN